MGGAAAVPFVVLFAAMSLHLAMHPSVSRSAPQLSQGIFSVAFRLFGITEPPAIAAAIQLTHWRSLGRTSTTREPAPAAPLVATVAVASDEFTGAPAVAIVAAGATSRKVLGQLGAHTASSHMAARSRASPAQVSTNGLTHRLRSTPIDVLLSSVCAPFLAPASLGNWSKLL